MNALRHLSGPASLLRWLVWSVFAGSMAVGCTCGTIDYNKPCQLVRLSADGGTVFLRQSELPDSGKTDFISFGDNACTDLVCIRSSGDPLTTPTTDNPDPVALGYCSTPCNPQSRSSTQCQSADNALDQDPKTHLTCRAILLDQATLDAICSADAGACEQYFANTRSPYFCGRGGDAGF